MKTTLLSTSATREGLQHCAIEFFCGNTSVILEDDGTVSKCKETKRHTVENLSWEKRGKRFALILAYGN